MSEPSIANWEGVGVDTAGRVQALWLPYNNLSGSIPPELGSLTKLVELQLPENRLTGSIPGELGGLGNLEDLDLSFNRLTGSIPAEFGNLSSLVRLNLWANQLTESIPAALGDLSSLEVLDLDENRLTGSIPPELGDLVNLTSLYLVSNQLTGSIPAAIAELANLEALMLAGNQLTGSIPVELAELGRRFEENLLDETAAYKKVVARAEELAGLPETALERAAQLAAEAEEEGWLLTLDMPSVQAVLQHADDRALRREIHGAYLDRCTSGERDNGPLVTRILEIRRQLAAVLGYPDFPDYRLETLMAGTGGRVRTFLNDLIDGTRPFHVRDTAALKEHACESGLGDLEPWDVSYLMEKMRKERFSVDDEMLRPWFPLDEVQKGLFEIAERLFGLSVKRVENPDVGFFEVRDEAGLHLGAFYTDWFPRDTKRQGAWMDNLVSGGPSRGGGFTPHLAFIGGNFTPPTASRPALLTHREVCTLFHEFGHLLHHTCSRVEIPERGGVNVAWDWVEVPSQIMENWCWEREALDLFARHYETGEALPDELLQRLLAARRFMGGWLQMRQLSFANLDLELHRTYRGDTPVMEYAARTLRPFVPSDRFVERHILPSFAHLFAGGYASAYYSYIWSETLEADAFSRFEAEGVLDPEVGRAFRDCILARGDSRDADELFRDFMGRDPDPAAVIRRNLGTPPQP